MAKHSAETSESLPITYQLNGEFVEHPYLQSHEARASWRRPSEAQYELLRSQIVNSDGTITLAQPISISEDGKILDGVQRARVVVEAGFEDELMLAIDKCLLDNDLNAVFTVSNQDDSDTCELAVVDSRDFSEDVDDEADSEGYWQEEVYDDETCSYGDCDSQEDFDDPEAIDGIEDSDETTEQANARNQLVWVTLAKTDNPRQFVIEQQLCRRNLSKGLRALYLADDYENSKTLHGITKKCFAAKYGIDERSFQRAAVILKASGEEAITRIENGTSTLQEEHETASGRQKENDASTSDATPKQGQELKKSKDDMKALASSLESEETQPTEPSEGDDADEEFVDEADEEAYCQDTDCDEELSDDELSDDAEPEFEDEWHDELDEADELAIPDLSDEQVLGRYYALLLVQPYEIRLSMAEFLANSLGLCVQKPAQSPQRRRRSKAKPADSVSSV